jgi:hypothetical protein
LHKCSILIFINNFILTRTAGCLRTFMRRNARSFGNRGGMDKRVLSICLTFKCSC